MSQVVLSEHARQRWRERGGKGQLRPGHVRHHLLGLLHAGAQTAPGCTVEVPFEPGWRAVCAPLAEGGWLVLTVYREEEAS